jgi:branched-chain amino acid transport system ATP-binding protein
MSQPIPLLEVIGLGKNFKGLLAVDQFNLKVFPGEIIGLIGPNGAGKTTVFNLLTGLFPVTTGRIILNQKELTGLRPDQIVKHGIARTFQNIRLFGDLSVIQNVLVAVQIHKRYSLGSALINSRPFKQEEKRLFTEAGRYLATLGLKDFQNQSAKNLPYGLQRKLEIARALATNPQILLLDEPAAGMNRRESEDLMETIRRIRDSFNLSVILIEHDMHVVMNLCDRLQVLSYGKTIASGDPEAIRNNPLVIEAYLGRSGQSA